MDIEQWLMNYRHSDATLLKVSRHWLGGEWRETADTGEDRVVINPNRGSKLFNYTTSPATFSSAVEAGDQALAPVNELSWGERLEIVRRLGEGLRHKRELFARALQIEAGKPAWDAYGEVANAIAHCQGVVDKGAYLGEALLAAAEISAWAPGAKVTLRGLGLSAAYLPFSNPVLTFAIYLSSAVLAGCPLLVVSSGHATLTTLILGEIAGTLGLPLGGLALLLGEFKDFRRGLADKRVASVLFVGSKEHGEQLQKDAFLQRKKLMVLQGGSKNSAIIHSSAVLGAAVKAVVYGVCKSAGQLPTSTSRVFVEEKILPEFCELLLASLQNLSIGPCDEMSVSESNLPLMGPLISGRSVERFLRFQTMARREAKVSLLQGKKLSRGGEGGFFVQPGIHLMDKYNPSSLYQSNMLFAPDCGVYPYGELEEVVDALGLSGQASSLAFMGEGELLKAYVPRLQVPNIIINGPTVELDQYFPFCSRALLNQAPLWGIGLSLALCSPQMLAQAGGGGSEFLDRLF